MAKKTDISSSSNLNNQDKIDFASRKEAIGKRGANFSAQPYLLLLPLCFFAAVFVFYPFVNTIIHSFTLVNFRGEVTGPAGLDNFQYLFSRKDFFIALKNTLKITAITVPLTSIICLVLALLSVDKRKLSPVYETMSMLPMAVSMSTKALIFRVMFHPTVGIVNYLLGTNYGWFRDSKTALTGIIILAVWMGIPFNYVLLLSALRSVPKEIISAAEVDGAGYFSTLFSVQIPLISPTLFYIICTDAIMALLISGPIILLTNGGPSRSTTTLIFMMYSSGYGSSNYSMAAAISIITLLLSLVFVFFAFLIEKRKVHYQ